MSWMRDLHHIGFALPRHAMARLHLSSGKENGAAVGVT